MSAKIMNVSELAKYLGFSTKKIYLLAEHKKIPTIKVGRQYRFVRKVIDEWLEEASISSLNSSKPKLELTRSNSKKDKGL